jgi:hypothetical protein
MKSRSLNWTTDDWRDAFYFRGTNRPPKRRLPDGYVSDEMQRARDEARDRQRRDEAMVADLRAHVQQLAEREKAERLQRLIAEHGRDAVATVLGHAGYALPDNKE